MDEARGYANLMELNGWNGKQVAEALRVSTSKVSRALALLDLPENIRRQIETGLISRTAAYELTKLGNDTTQRDLAEQAATGSLTHKQAIGAVRQRKGKKAGSKTGIRETFYAQNDIKVIVSASRKGNYHEVEEALLEALDEVRLRIKSNIQLL